MQSKAKTVKEYLKSLPADRKKAILTVRKVILKNLPKGYEETISYGMIGYAVPLKIFPEGYLDRKDEPIGIAALASQKNYMALYLMTVYGDKKMDKWFREQYKKSGKKLDMGKSCVRFKKLEDLPLDLIGKTIAKVPMDKYITMYKNSKKGRRYE